MNYLSQLMALLCIFLMQNPKGAHLQLTTLPTADVVNYINNRIDNLLVKNPERDIRELQLNAEFNEERGLLFVAIIMEPVELGSDVQAEEAIQRFNHFLSRFNKVSRRLVTAINFVSDIESDPNYPTSVRYNALILLSELINSDCITEAQRILKRIIFFQIYINVTKPQLIENPLPANDEYEHYFEEMLNILNQNGTNIKDPEVKDVLNFIESH